MGASTLYFAVDFGSGSILSSLSTTTGAATMIGPTGTSVIGAMVFESRTLYICTICTDNYSNAVVVYTLNTTTGMGMFVTHVSGIRVSFMG